MIYFWATIAVLAVLYLRGITAQLAVLNYNFVKVVNHDTNINGKLHRIGEVLQDISKDTKKMVV